MLDELIKSGQEEIQLIIFKLGSEEYAVPINCIQEIILPQKATRIPKSPMYVAGVINLRGNIIPVIDGKKKFHLENSSKQISDDERIMVLEVENEISGLVVDAVDEVITLKVTDIEPPPIDMETGSDIFWGIVKHENRLLILVNSEKFLDINDEEKETVKTFNKITEVVKRAKA